MTFTCCYCTFLSKQDLIQNILNPNIFLVKRYKYKIQIQITRMCSIQNWNGTMLEIKVLMPRFLQKLLSPWRVTALGWIIKISFFHCLRRFSFFIIYKRIAHTPLCTWFNKLITVYGTKKLTNHFLPGAVTNPRMHILNLQEDSWMHLISKNRLQEGYLWLLRLLLDMGMILVNKDFLYSPKS